MLVFSLPQISSLILAPENVVVVVIVPAIVPPSTSSPMEDSVSSSPSLATPSFLLVSGFLHRRGSQAYPHHISASATLLPDSHAHAVSAMDGSHD